MFMRYPTTCPVAVTVHSGYCYRYTLSWGDQETPQMCPAVDPGFVCQHVA